MEVVIVPVTTFIGKDTMIQCYHYSTEDDHKEATIYMIVDCNTGEEVDNGYRSMAEASKYYPMAKNALKPCPQCGAIKEK